jgi:hypothetical protein
MSVKIETIRASESRVIFIVNFLGGSCRENSSLSTQPFSKEITALQLDTKIGRTLLACEACRQ